MAEIWKDSLYPGTWLLADGREVTYTPAQVRYYHDRAKEMLSAGAAMPFCWEHQDDCLPMTEAERLALEAEQKARKTKTTLGHVKDVRLSPEGFLETLLVVPDADDFKRLPSVRFVSPEINTKVRAAGREWDGPSITHIAATARPVQHTQRPFDIGAVRMSQGAGGPIRLSLEGYKMAKEDADLPPDDDEDDEPETPPEDANPDAAAPVEDPRLAEVLNVLRGDGYHLPNDTNIGNLLERLHTAALTKKANTDPAGDASTTTGGQADAPAPVQPVNNPVMMSLEAKAKGLEAKNARLESRLITSERDGLRRRVDRLLDSGRINRPIHGQLTADLGAVRLSLDDAAELVAPALLAKVEAYEALPKNTTGFAQLSLDGIRPADRPEDAGGAAAGDDDEIISAVVEHHWGGRRRS